MDRKSITGFTYALSCAVCGKEELAKSLQTISEWPEILDMADRNNLLPLIANVILPLINAKSSGDISARNYWQQKAMRELSMQMVRTREFLDLMQDFHGVGLKPIVVSGIVCRRLYPEPNACSSDRETLIVEAGKWSVYDRFLHERGYRVMNTESPEEAYTVTYASQDRLLQLELCKTLFSPGTNSSENPNRFFSGLREHAVYTPEYAVPCSTDHFLYLLLHAFRLFPHTGFDFHKACDVSLFAAVNGQKIDWNYIRKCCRTLGCDAFMAAVLRFGWKRLKISLPIEKFPAALYEQICSVDEDTLLKYHKVPGKEEYCIRITGSSMAPFLCHERDFAYYKAPYRALKQGDIVFYRRDSGRRVLHRIIRVNKKENLYDMIGDGQTEIEHGIRPEQIFGLVTRVSRNGRRIDPTSFWWWWFKVVWLYMMPLRRIYIRRSHS